MKQFINNVFLNNQEYLPQTMSNNSYICKKNKIMSHVSIGHIEAAIQKVDTLDENALDRLSETQTTAQPTLLGYVMSAAQEYQNEELESLLIYYFL